MKNLQRYFHYVSYLQYPLMLVSLFFAYKPFFVGMDTVWINFNNTLIFMGLAISFSTLQDITKTQNKLSLRIYQNPKSAKAFLIFIMLLIAFFIGLGLLALFALNDQKVEELALGLIVLGIGLMGMLKSAAEMADNHRLDA